MRLLILCAALWWPCAALCAQPALYLIETNAIPQVVEVDQIGIVTNDAGGFAVGTNRVLVTNFVYTLNLIRTNHVSEQPRYEIDSPSTDAIPTGKWSEILSAVIAAIAAAIYHLWKQHQNQKVNASLVQGIETGIKVIESSPDGESARDRYKEWLGFQQRSKGVQSTISKLVENQDPMDMMLVEQAAENIVKQPQAEEKTVEAQT